MAFFRDCWCFLTSFFVLQKFLPQGMSPQQEQRTLQQLFSGGFARFGKAPVREFGKKLKGSSLIHALSRLGLCFVPRLN
jgi:hypothetical protein